MRTNFIDVSKPAAADLHEFFLEDLAGDYTLQIDKTTGDAQFVSAKGLAFGIAVDSKSLADLRPIIYELKLPSLDFAGKVCGNIDFKKKIVIR